MPLLNPKSIAVIGASVTEGSVGYDVLQNLLTEGYRGNVYPINPKYPEILGKKCFSSILDIPEPIDLAVIVIPAKVVPGVLRDCGQKGIKNSVIISAGFGETHADDGKNLEKELEAIAKEYDMHMVGPNCLGILRPSIGMNASFAKELPQRGNIALISQSGAMAVALMDASPSMHLGYSFIISIGNKTTMDECDFLEVCEEDEETKVVGLYLENIKDGRRFLDLAQRIQNIKPIVLLKAGISEQGKRAASSHTGALAGSDAAIDAVCAQAGIHRAHSTEEFLDLLSVLSLEPPLLSSNIAIITNAGGPGILATDAAELAGLSLPRLSKEIEKKLREALPPAASTSNPIDVVGDADTDRYTAALDACGDDPHIDGVCVLLTPQVMTPCEEIAKAIIDWKKSHPLMSVVTSFMGEESVTKARELLLKNGIPTFRTPERAIQALSALHNKGQQTKHVILLAGQSPPEADDGWRCESRTLTCMDSTGLTMTCKGAGRASKHHTMQELLKGQKGLLSETLVQQLFSLYDLPLPKQRLAHSADEAAEIAHDIGFPVIAKVSSPDILHKTDIGGIKGNLKTEEEVRAAFDTIKTNVEVHAPHARWNGVLIQKFLPIGNEFIIGGLRDPSFGALIMVGLGGIYTELFRDTSFRIAPITEEEGYKMLQNLKSWNLLLGLRGKGQSDIAGLVKVLSTVSHMVTDCTKITELDINPILVGEEGIVIADVKLCCLVPDTSPDSLRA